VAEVLQVLGGHYELLVGDQVQSQRHWQLAVQVLKAIGMVWSLAMANCFVNIGR
jgi:hypothetical protein